MLPKKVFIFFEQRIYFSFSAARLLFEAGYPVPPDMCVSSAWRLSQMGLAMPPVPTDEDRIMEIHALRDAMTPEQRENPVWDAENNVSWNAFFTERRERQLNDYRTPLP